MRFLLKRLDTRTRKHEDRKEGTGMLGVNFTSFLTLLVISVVVASVYHWILRYHFLEGIDSFLAKVALGWMEDG
jgi:hypothetical protein